MKPFVLNKVKKKTSILQSMLGYKDAESVLASESRPKTHTQTQSCSYLSLMGFDPRNLQGRKAWQKAVDGFLHFNVGGNRDRRNVSKGKETHTSECLCTYSVSVCLKEQLHTDRTHETKVKRSLSDRDKSNNIVLLVVFHLKMQLHCQCPTCPIFCRTLLPCTAMTPNTGQDIVTSNQFSTPHIRMTQTCTISQRKGKTTLTCSRLVRYRRAKTYNSPSNT